MFGGKARDVPARTAIFAQRLRSARSVLPYAAPDGAARRHRRRRRDLGHRCRLSPADELPEQDVRDPRGTRRDRRHLGSVSLSRAFARTRTCTRSAIPFRPWQDSQGDRRWRRRSSQYIARDRGRRTASTARSAIATASARALVERATRAGRVDASRRERREASSSRAVPLHVRGLLRLRRAATRRSSPGAERFKGRIVHPQQWTARHRLRGQARRRDRQRRDRGDARARAREAGRARDDAAALADVHHVAARRRIRSPTGCASGCRRAARTRSRAGRTCCSAWRSITYCRRLPERAKRLIVEQVEQAAGGRTSTRAHFTPTLQPVGPAAVPRARRGSVQGDPRGPRVGRHRSDRDVHRDRHRAALGQRARRRPRSSPRRASPAAVRRQSSSTSTARRSMRRRRSIYKGMMLSATCRTSRSRSATRTRRGRSSAISRASYVCRLLNYMDKHGYTRVRAAQRDPACRGAAADRLLVGLRAARDRPVPEAGDRRCRGSCTRTTRSIS